MTAPFVSLSPSLTHSPPPPPHFLQRPHRPPLQSCSQPLQKIHRPAPSISRSSQRRPLRCGLDSAFALLNIWGLSQRLEAAPSISGFLITPFPVPAVMQFRKGGGKRMFLRCFYMFSPHMPLQSHSSGFVCVCPVVFLPPGWDEQSSYQAAAL